MSQPFPHPAKNKKKRMTGSGSLSWAPTQEEEQSHSGRTLALTHHAATPSLSRAPSQPGLSSPRLGHCLVSRAPWSSPRCHVRKLVPRLSECLPGGLAPGELVPVTGALGRPHLRQELEEGELLSGPGHPEGLSCMRRGGLHLNHMTVSRQERLRQAEHRPGECTGRE